MLLLLLPVLFLSCEEESRFEEGDVPVISNITGNAPLDYGSGVFYLEDIENAAVSFDVDILGVPVNSIELYISKANSATRASLASINSFPSNVTITALEAAAATNVAVENLDAWDSFRVYFVCRTKNGRTLRNRERLSIEVRE